MSKSIHKLVQLYRDPGLGYAYYRLKERLHGSRSWSRIPGSELSEMWAVSPNVVTRYTDTLHEHGLILKLNRRSGSRTLSYYRLPIAKSETVPSHNLRSLNNLSNLINDDSDIAEKHKPAHEILKNAGIRHTHPRYEEMLEKDIPYLSAWAAHVKTNVTGNPAGYMITAILKNDPVPDTTPTPPAKNYAIPDDPPPAPVQTEDAKPVTPRALPILRPSLPEPAASEWRIIRTALELQANRAWHIWQHVYPLRITSEEVVLVPPKDIDERTAHHWHKSFEKAAQNALLRDVSIRFVFDPSTEKEKEAIA